MAFKNLFQRNKDVVGMATAKRSVFGKPLVIGLAFLLAIGGVVGYRA